MNATMLRILMMSEDIPSPMQAKIMWGPDDCQVKPTKSFGAGFCRDKFH